MSTITIFTFLVINIYSEEHPIFKASCINGYGHGYGKTIEDAVENCRKCVKDLVEIYREINLSLDLKTKEQILATRDIRGMVYEMGGGDNSPIHWTEMEYKTLMGEEEPSGTKQ